MSQKLPVCVEEEEFVKIIKNTNQEHHKLAFLLGFGSGLRISEIVGQKRKLTNCCEEKVRKQNIKEGEKRSKKYFCSKCDKELNLLKDVHESKVENDWEIPPIEKNRINVEEKKIMIVNAKGSKDRITALPKGFKQKHLAMLPIKCKARSLQIAFKNACRKAGILETKPTIHFHSLRHGFATQMIANGVPIHHIKMLMGHSNIATTSLYLISNPKDALKSYQDLF